MIFMIAECLYNVIKVNNKVITTEIYIKINQINKNEWVLIFSQESLSMTSYLIDHLDIMPHDTRIKVRRIFTSQYNASTVKQTTAFQGFKAASTNKGLAAIVHSFWCRIF